jgi:hypothetical protein
MGVGFMWGMGRVRIMVYVLQLILFLVLNRMYVKKRGDNYGQKRGTEEKNIFAYYLCKRLFLVLGEASINSISGIGLIVSVLESCLE